MLPTRKELLFLAIVFAVLFHALELSYRGYQRVALGVPVFAAGAGDDAGDAVASVRSIVVGHPLLHYALNPDMPGHTKDHYRVTPDAGGAPPSVFCLGGSSTYGSGLTAADSFPARLHAHLASAGKPAKVMNGGTPGWSLPHHLARTVFDLRERQPRPRLAILYLGYNDLWSNVARTRAGPVHEDGLRHFPVRPPSWMSYRILVWFFSRLKLATGWEGPPTHLNDFAFVPRAMDLGRAGEANLRRFESELDFLLRTLASDGIAAVVVLEDLANPYMDARLRAGLATVQESMRRVAARHGATLLDSGEATQGRRELFLDEIHHGARGADVFARWLAERVAALP